MLVVLVRLHEAIPRSGEGEPRTTPARSEGSSASVADLGWPETEGFEHMRSATIYLLSLIALLGILLFAVYGFSWLAEQLT